VEDDRLAKEEAAMPPPVRENRVKTVLKNDELVLCMGVNQLASCQSIGVLASKKFAASPISSSRRQAGTQAIPGYRPSPV
jgi:hypothetical protein